MLPDALILGGGVIGLSVAMRLAQAGLRVRVVERGQVGREASWAAAGVLDPGSLTRTDTLALLRRRSAAMYPAFTAEVHELSGIDPEYLPCGGLDLIEDENQERAAQREVAAARAAPAQGSAVPGAANAASGERESRAATRSDTPAHASVAHWSTPELLTAEPALSPRLGGCLWKPAVAQVRNPRLMAGLATACRALGAAIDEGVEVRCIDVAGGRASAIAVDGARLAAGLIVLAAGAWSSHVLRESSPHLTVRPVRGQIVLLEGAAVSLTHVIQSGKRYLVPRRDGRILIGSTEEHDSGFEKRNTAAGVAWLLEFALRVAPNARSATLAAMWSGLRPHTPSGRPLIHRVPEASNLVLATGHFRSGLVLAPATAEIVARLARGEPAADLWPEQPDEPGAVA